VFIEKVAWKPGFHCGSILKQLSLDVAVGIKVLCEL